MISLMDPEADTEAPACAPGTFTLRPSIGTRRSVRCSVTPKGGASIGERSRRSIPVGPSGF